MNETLKPLILATGLLIALSLGWYFLIYKPDAQKLESVETDIEDLLLKLQSFSVSEEQIDALETQIDKLENELEITQSKLITKDELSTTIKLLQQRGKSYGLKFETMLPDFDALMDDPEKAEAVEEILRLNLQMKISGRYRNFGRFLESLESLPFYISVKELTLLFNQQTHPEIDIIAEGALYVRINSESASRT